MKYLPAFKTGVMASVESIIAKTVISSIFILLNVPLLQAQWIQQGPGPSKNGQVEGITDK